MDTEITSFHHTIHDTYIIHVFFKKKKKKNIHICEFLLTLFKAIYIVIISTTSNAAITKQVQQNIEETLFS
jgi:hypothetical protein